MSGFHLPDLGEGLTEAEIVVWHVGPGDHVVADQPLVTVETDKAVVEIPAPRSGHIARLAAEPGAIVEVGDLLVEFTDTDPADHGAIVGELETATPPGEPAPQQAGAVAPSRARATPAVRRRARELGLDLDTITPTGPGGTVTTADLEAVSHGAAAAEPDLEPLRGVRRAMDGAMRRAHAEVVPATVTEVADVGAWPDGTDVTVRLVQAVVAACRAEPALNATYPGRDIGLRRHDTVHLGLATDTADGLFVPVVRSCERLDPDGLRAELDRLTRAVAERTIAPDELTGATITLSNFGALGGRHASLVVVPPTVAIVGAGRLTPTVLAVDGVPTVRPTLPLSLTFDHRVVTGGEATRFLVALVSDLEDSR